MTDPIDTQPGHEPPSRSGALALGATTLLASGLLRQGLGVLTLIVTARLLSPEDFGIIAYFLIVTSLLFILQRQIIVSLIRLETVTPDHLNTVFTIQILFGVGTSLLIWLTLPGVVWLGLPELKQLGPALILYSLILPFVSPRFLMFERELRFGPAAVIETISRVAYSIIVVLLAWWWRDFWAVVVATFAGQILGAALSFRLAPMIPRLTLARWRDSISFSTWGLGSQVVQFISESLPQMFIGPALGLADAGLFRLGERITDIVTSQLFNPIQRVLYPGLADAARKTDRKQEVFMKMNAALLAIVLPVSIGAALVAEDVIRLAMGEKWLAAALVIWILAPLKALEMLQDNVRDAHYVDGTLRTLFFRNIILLATTSLFMWIGIKFGFSGAIISAGFSSLAALFMTLLMARKFTSGGFLTPLLSSWRSFLSSGMMVAAVIALDLAYRTADNDPHLVLVLVSKIVVASIVYPAVHLLLWRLTGRPDGLERFLLSRLGNKHRAS